MSSTTDNNVVDLNALSDDEKTQYMSNRLDKFKLTIFICVLYGVFAAIMLLLTFFTSWGKKFLYEEMYAFVVAYIIGTVIIIIYMANEVYSFKPIVNKATLGYDAETCPDYWKLKYVGDDFFRQQDSEGKPFLSSTVNKNQFRYKCELDDRLFDKTDIKNYHKLKDNTELKEFANENKNLYTTINETNKNDITKKYDELNQFKTIAANMIGYDYDSQNTKLTFNSSNAFRDDKGNFFQDATQIPVACDIVYPMYLSVMDKEYKDKNPDQPNNRFRCLYAKACGITWSDAGCE